MASTVSLVQMLAAGMVTSTGAPIASGRASFYLPGTLTPVSVYSDTAAATPISPPLVLTAGGTAIAYTKVPTRMIVKDSLGVTTYFDGLVNIGRAEQEMIQSVAINGGAEITMQAWLDAYSTSFGGTAGLWKIKTSATAVERNLIDILFDNAATSVKSFGAAGDGVADDTAEIQATVDYVASLGGGTVYFPPGTYLTSAAITLSVAAPIVLRGADRYVSIIRNTNATGNGFTITALSQFSFRDLTIRHATASTGHGIRGSGVLYVAYVDNVIIQGHAVGMSVGAGGAYISSAAFTTSAASTSAALVTSGGTVVNGGGFSSTSGIGIQVADGDTRAYGIIGSGGTAFVDVAAGGSLFVHGASNTTGSLGLRTAAGASIVQHTACNWVTVTDARTGAPVNYVFAGANNMTPLPLQADVIRVEQSTGGVVTTINNIAAIGFKAFTLICSNTSAGASTFTFGANYVLSAAVTPAAGTRVALKLYYDPITGKTCESGRGATAN